MGKRYDPLTPEQRSERMSRIRGAGTKPELAVRRLVFGLGYRCRLQRAELPGKPDLVFSKRKKVIFVHGCFWHQHGCQQYRMPKTRREFWEPKLRKNVARDRSVARKLRRLGWGVLTIWECELKNVERLTRRIRRFMDR